MPNEILPCPFCGSERITVQHIRDGAQAICKDCGSKAAPTFHGKDGVDATWEHAREAWNRRTSPSAAERHEGAIPEGWVLVPKQPTKEMAYKAACAHYGVGRVNAVGG